jgi:endonuclease/exonuclease/phosphatase (EEP) superfamily protein YafD
VKAILWLGTSALLLASLSALLAQSWWLLDLSSHFRFQYTVAALLLAALAIALRAWPLVTLLLGIALLHGWTIRGLWLAPAPTDAATGRPLRIASANVERNNPRPQAVADWVRRSDADLLMLIEADGSRWSPVLADIAADYPERVPEDWEAGSPVILLSRHPIRDWRTIRPTNERRPYLLAEVGIDGRSFSVLVVHPASPSPADAGGTRRRNRELDHIALCVSGLDRPVIVAGDFNTSPWSPHFRDLTQAADLRLAAAGHGYIGTWPRWLPPARIPIDHILLRGPLAVQDFRRGPAIGSDHYPIIADLRLGGR